MKKRPYLRKVYAGKFTETEAWRFEERIKGIRILSECLGPYVYKIEKRLSRFEQTPSRITEAYSSIVEELVAEHEKAFKGELLYHEEVED